MTYFPMFIATLSLVTSIFNGYLNARFVDLIQRNLSRIDYMRTCKEMIDAYFQVKFRATVISRMRAQRGRRRTAMTAEQIEGANAVAKIGALGTYLANLRDETIRAALHGHEHRARQGRQAMRQTRHPKSSTSCSRRPTRIFADLNADCVKSALDRPM